MNRLFFGILFLLLACASCFGQTSYKGLTPGKSTKADVERALGQPTSQVSESLFEYSKGDSQIYIQYSKTSPAAIRILSIYSPAREREQVLAAEKLPRVADTRRTNKKGALEEYFGHPKYIVLTYEKNSQTQVSQIGYYSPELFEVAAGSGQIRDMQLENDIAMDGTTLTYYPRSGVDECKSDCAKNANCKGFTWIKAGTYNPGDGAMCYLVSAVTKKYPARGHISGVKQ